MVFYMFLFLLLRCMRVKWGCGRPRPRTADHKNQKLDDIIMVLSRDMVQLNSAG